jgi:RNA polymerase sigma-70 factor (ECF subfamily)
MTGPHDDLALVEAARNGDRAAMERLLRTHHDRIFAVCRRITGNDADAADASQDALIAIVRHLDRFDGRSAFGTWAYRIATNASLDELRRRSRRPMVVHDDLASSDRHRSVIDQSANTRIDAVADRDLIDGALGGVPDDFRIPLVLRDVADLDYSEIAAVLEIPIGTVKSRIARGRAALAQALRDGNRPDPSERPTTAS